MIANATETLAATTTTSNSSSTGDDEDRMSTTNTPSSTSQRDADATPSPSSSTDGRINEDTSIRRGSGIDTEGIIGIAIGCVAVVALAVAFVHAGSSKRKKQAQQGELLTAVQDLASSTMSVKDVKYIESLDSSTGSPRTSTIAAIRKPTVPHHHHRPQGGGSMYSTTDSSISGASGSAAPAAALVQTSASAAQPQPTGATIVDVDDEPKPHRMVRTFSRSQRSGSSHDALKKAPLSPDSYLKFAQNSFRQSRRSARHSRAMESPNPNAMASSSSPVVHLQRSRMRFSRRGSLHASRNEDDSAADIPMLGGGGDGGISARSSNNSSQNDPTSPRDIPVLARGSEESVDSVEDDDVEISI